MEPTISGRRARKIAAIQDDIDRLRTAVLAMSAELDALEDELSRLVRIRHRGLTRDALTLLRRAGEPMPIRALTLRLMEAREMDTTDARLTRTIVERVRLLLHRQERAGVVRKGRGKEPEGRVVWSIAG
jgi:hypothetical protein